MPTEPLTEPPRRSPARRKQFRHAAVQDAPPGAVSLATTLRRVRTDGTVAMIAGTIVAGFAYYAWQAAGTRILGEVRFAPVATTWTLMFLIVTILLAPVEQFATRNVAAGWEGRAHLARSLRSLARFAAGATFLVTLVAFLLRDSLFGGDGAYALIGGAMVLGFGQLALCRGVLAGERRLASYGWLTALDSLVRVAVALPLLIATDSVLLFAWTIPLSTLVALWWVREVPGRDEAAAEHAPGPAVGPFIATTVGGLSAAQLILAGGPLFVSLLGGSEATVSGLFVTQTAFRAAFLVATPGWARVLPVLTGIHVRAEHQRLTRIAEAILLGTVFSAAIAGLIVSVIGPPVIAAFFGEGVRPSGFLAATMAAGTVIAIGNLGLNQVLVARVKTARITVGWWIGLAAMAVWIAFAPGSVLNRVAVGFVVGETVALVMLTVASSSRLAPRKVREIVYRQRDRHAQGCGDSGSARSRV
jgi:O-antigen/teichoic acid export membrane protein